MPKEVRSVSHSADNSFGVAGVVLGILSILSFSLQGVLLGIIGLFFSSKQSQQNVNQWSKMGKALSIIGLILNVVLIIIAIIIYSKYPGVFPVPQLPS